MNISIIGSGNLAFHMCRMMRVAKVPILQVCARNEKEGKKMAKYAKATFCNRLDALDDNADIYILCVSDGAIKIVANQLPDIIKKTKIVVHTSGSKPITDLTGCAKKGVFYPLQTFSKGKRMSYRNIPFCINGASGDIMDTLESIAQKISSNVHRINDAQRKTIHVSAVIISNFINHLIYKSESMLTAQNIDASILQPLLLETIKKQAKIGAFDAQTGPARRQDKEVIDQHIHQLAGIDAEMYRILSDSIANTYKK